MKTNLFLTSLALVFLFPSRMETKAANAIQTENLNAGTTAWQLSNPAGAREIEGYASATSVNAGGQIRLYVSTASSSYSMTIYRMGWYQGNGARLMLGPVTRSGSLQTTPGADAYGRIECNWTNPYVLTVPANWVSGFYLAKLHNSDSVGKESYIIFVVRNDSRNADFLFQSAVTTYQAYNNWPGVDAGGQDLYPYNSTNGAAARKVSLDRPYGAGLYPANGSFSGVGAGDFLTHDFSSGPLAFNGNSNAAGWEYSMVRWLEKEGYDVAYVTDVDTHENGNLLLGRRGFLSVGHDEYWSREMRLHVEAARDSGVHLAFLGGNLCFWQIRFETNSLGQSDRTIVCYKFGVNYNDDPLTNLANGIYVTGQFNSSLVGKNVPGDWPEEALIGGSWVACDANPDILIGDTTSWVFSNTLLGPGDVLPKLVGYEWNENLYGLPAGVQILAHSPVICPAICAGHYSDMTMYTASSGAVVFNAGTVQWSWGLDDYNTGLGASNGPPLRPSRLTGGAQQITRNVLSRFLSPAITNSTGNIMPVAAGGTALTLNGVDQFLECPSSTDLNAFPLTITAWIKTSDATGSRGIVNKYASGSFNGYQIYLLNGQVRAWYFRDGADYVWDGADGLNGGNVNDGQWHHLAFAVDASGGKLYVDGVLNSNASRAWAGSPGAATTSQPLRFGEYSGGFLHGQIDEISLWSTALGQATIQAGYRQGLHGMESNLIGYWRFEEMCGPYAYDNSAHGHTAAFNTCILRVPSTAPLRTAYSTPSGTTNSPAGTDLFLDGGGSYLEAAHAPELNAFPLTLTAWIRTTQTTGSYGIIKKYGPGSENGYLLRVLDGNLRAWYFRDSSNYVWDGADGLNGGPVANGQWHHVGFTVDALGGKLYVDGTLTASNSWTNIAGPPTTEDDLVFGAYDSFLRGEMDEVSLWNVALNPQEMALYYRQGLCGTESGLIGYWRFDDATGEVALDDSGHGHDAALYGGCWLTSTAPVTSCFAGSALTFNGTNQYVQVAHASELDAYPLTVAAWIKTTDLTGLKGIVNKYVSASGNGYQIYLYNGQVRAWYFRDPANYVWDGADGLNGGNIADGFWHDLAFTVDSSGGKLYVDGGLKASRGWTGTPGATTTAQPLRFGEYNGGDLLGRLDEISLWNIARSSGAIAAGYRRRLSGSEPGLIGYWRFDEGTGSSAFDTSGHGHNGTLVNAPSWVSSPIPCLDLNLQVNRLGTNVVLAWPDAADFAVLSASNLTPPVTWSYVSNSVSVVNGQNQVTLGPSGSRKFFRLILH